MVNIDGLSDLELIGSGGFSDVYRARDDEHDRHVAVKVLRRIDDTAEQHRLFDRERSAMGRLGDHDGIVAVYRSGITDEGTPYLVMPYLPSSMADMIAEGPMDPDLAAGVLAQVALAVQFAHDNDVVHRDIKPANILLSSHNRPLVADFGISKIVDAAAAASSNALRGTPEYSAPEVFAGAYAAPSDDIYSLGATLFACLAGRRPFTQPGDGQLSPWAMVTRVNEEPVEDLRPLGVPVALCDVVEQAMAKSANDRPATAAEFRSALLRHLGVDEPSAPPVASVSGASARSTSIEPDPHAAATLPPDALSSRTRSQGESLATRATKTIGNRGRIAMMAAAAGVVALIALLVATRGDDPTASPATSTTTAPAAQAEAGSGIDVTVDEVRADGPNAVIRFSTSVPTQVWYQIVATDGSHTAHDRRGYTPMAWETHRFNSDTQNEPLMDGVEYRVFVRLQSEDGLSQTSFERTIVGGPVS